MTTSLAQQLHIYLTLEQSSLLLEALMEQPFKRVFDVIGSLNQQAQQFYQPDTDKNSAQLFVLSKNDFSTCVKALGELPYNRVCSLIQNLHQQLTTQLHTMPDNQSNDSENAGNLTMNSNISGMKTTP